jgi:carboxypeptidase Taq
MNAHIEKLKEKDREIFLLIHAAAILGWDQETYMPAGAVEERAEQLSLLEGLIHQKITDHETGELLVRLGVDRDNPYGTYDLSDLDKAFVREIERRYSRNTKLPARLRRTSPCSFPT